MEELEIITKDNHNYKIDIQMQQFSTIL